MTGTAQALAELREVDLLADRLDGRNIRISLDVDGLASTLAQLAAAAAASTVLGGLGSSSGGIGGLSKGLSGAAGAAISLGTALAQASAMATALAVGGAAITGAYAAASTAVAVLPAALALAAAPIATVMAGMDGIKRAAASIKPEFDALKASVSATFERGLTPILQRLATQVFPTLETGMNRVAESIVGIAGRLTEMVASEAGLARLNAIFTNVSTTLERMSPGIAAITDGFLILASQSRAFDPLLTAVNEFGTRFRANVLDLLNDGTLDEAFTGLSDMAGIAARGLADLVKNGIEAFAAAAPGMNAGLQSISDFFNRFNWDSLGASVGGVFRGLGEAIDSIDTQTFRDIETAFGDLAKAFEDPAFKANIKTMFEGVPAALELGKRLVTGFGEIGAGVSLAIQEIDRALDQFDTVNTKFSDGVDGILKKVEEFGTKLGVGKGTPISEWLRDLDDSIDRALGILPPKAEELGTKTGDGAARGMRGGGGKFGEAAGEAADKVPPALEQGLAPAEGVVTSGAQGMVEALANGLAQSQAAVTQSFAGIAIAAAAGMTAATQSIANGTAQWVVAVMGGMTAMQETITAGVTAMAAMAASSFAMVGAAVTAGMATATTAIAVGTAQWVVAISTGMQAVTMTIAAQSAQWTVAIAAAMTALQVAVTTGFTLLATAATTGMTAITLAIATGTAQWTVAVTTGMQALQLTVQAGFAGLAATATAGMALVSSAISAGALLWGVAISNGMLNLNTVLQAGFMMLAATATTGMTTVAAAITAGMLLWATAITNGMVGMAAAVTAGFAQILAAVQAGMAQVQAALTVNWAAAVAAVTAAMAQMNTAITTGMQQGTTAVQQGAQQQTQAIQQGMRDSLAAVQQGIRDMVSALNASVGQFRSAGANMGNALADGLRSALPAVRAAADALAAEAARAVAARAQINSPSRVFIGLGSDMGEGLKLGLHDAKSGIIAEAASIVDGLNAELSRTDTAAVSDAFDDISSGLSGRVMRSTAEVDAALVGAGAAAGGRVVNNVTNVYASDAERGADKVAHSQRRLSAMGLFG